jgi:hypothetical protein
MNSIIFLGTSHLDPDGFRNLYAALERHRPDLILLEVSRLSVLLRKTLGALYLKILRRNLAELRLDINPEIRQVIAYLGVPFEYAAARDYAAGCACRFKLIDVSLFTLARFAGAHALMGRENLRALSAATADRFERERQIAMRIFREGDISALRFSLSRRSKDLLLPVRERILSRRVNRHLRRGGGARIAYVGGWEHLVDGPGWSTVYSLAPSPKEREIVFI